MSDRHKDGRELDEPLEEDVFAINIANGSPGYGDEPRKTGRSRRRGENPHGQFRFRIASNNGSLLVGSRGIEVLTSQSEVKAFQTRKRAYRQGASDTGIVIILNPVIEQFVMEATVVCKSGDLES